MPPDPAASRPPHVRSHWIPRTGVGRRATVLFLVLTALAQPPVVHGFADRVEPWILGVPFLYAWLLAVYAASIAVLVWAAAATERGAGAADDRGRDRGRDGGREPRAP